MSDPATPKYTVERLNRTVTLVRFHDVRVGWNHSILCSSDRHHDNLHAQHALEKKHLDEAVKRDASIIDIGDLFCAMQGKWDPRSDQNALREELRGNNYLDNLVEYNTNFYLPYAKRFIQVSPGNHETGVLKRAGSDLTTRFAERMNVLGDSHIQVGTYAGVIGFRFHWHGTKSNTVWLYYHHGYGGGGPITKGVIQANRMGVYLPDVELVWSGHVHESWQMVNARMRISAMGSVSYDQQIHFKTPGYKDEFDPQEGFHIEKGRPPKPLGAAWLNFAAVKQNADDWGSIDYTIEPAT
jgi:hypothetical protein